MKDKNVAGILALFFGWAGVHRFYLGQIWVGIVYIILMSTIIFPMIIGIIDAILLFTMDQNTFDDKYNNGGPSGSGSDRYRERSTQRRQRRDQGYTSESHQSRYQERKRRAQERPSKPQSNPYRDSGIKKYKEYDFKGAIADFKKSLEINSRDKNVHFILSCSYSFMEDLHSSLFHLSKAVEQGFNDFEKVHSHDALAYLRTQPEFERFVDNGYQIVKKIEAPPQEQELELDDIILNKIQRLGELKEKGFITDDEFESQKRKLLG